MNGKWTTNMKQKLDGHRKTPPAGLWESISSEMGLQNEPAPKTIAIKRWLWAAAVILALVGFFALYPFDQSEPLPQVAQTTYTTETPREPKSPITNKEESPENQQPNLVAKPIHEVREETVQQETSIEMPQQEVSEEQPQQKVAEESPKQTATVASHLTHSETDHHAIAHYQAMQMITSHAGDKWSIGLNASGGLLASLGLHSTNQENYVASNYDATNGNANGINLSHEPPSYTNTHFVSKHHLPVSLGLSLHYQLNPRLAFL